MIRRIGVVLALLAMIGATGCQSMRHHPTCAGPISDSGDTARASNGHVVGRSIAKAGETVQTAAAIAVLPVVLIPAFAFCHALKPRYP